MEVGQSSRGPRPCRCILVVVQDKDAEQLGILRHDPGCFIERNGETGFLKSRAYRRLKDRPWH